MARSVAYQYEDQEALLEETPIDSERSSCRTRANTVRATAVTVGALLIVGLVTYACRVPSPLAHDTHGTLDAEIQRKDEDASAEAHGEDDANAEASGEDDDADDADDQHLTHAQLIEQNLAKLRAEGEKSWDDGHKYRQKYCSGDGENCNATGCCKAEGTMCYRKDAIWAACRQECIAEAPDPVDINKRPWACNILGPRAPGLFQPNIHQGPAEWLADTCSGPGDNCNASRCCTDPGQACFMKNQNYSMCKPECTAGPDPVDPDWHNWNCTKLGYHTPGAYAGNQWAVAADWVAGNCSAKGENCMDSRCCKDGGYQCYVKVFNSSSDQGWATCMPSCVAGPLLTDQNSDKWNCTALGARTPGHAPPKGEPQLADWVKTECATGNDNCRSSMCCQKATEQCYEKEAPNGTHGGMAKCSTSCKADQDDGKWTCKTLGPRTPRPWNKPSLYCLSVFMVWSYEAEIIRTQINTNGGIGIFACEQYDIFSTDGETYMGDGPLGPVRSNYFVNAAVGRSVDGTAANTRLFINAWNAVKIIGRWEKTDFTVKADPDAVVIADRLRWHLGNMLGRPTYVINCNKGGMAPMMFGSLEAISRQGMEKFFNTEGNCMGMPLDAWGEDKWLGNCLNSVGAGGSADFGMVSDGVCNGLNCGSGAAVFHPLKNKGAWLGCYWAATGR